MKKGYLDVGDGHSIFYETFGNPKGVNVLFLHGGPGFNFSDHDKRFFDPELFHVVFFDQRGCGKSTPFGSLHNNTTANLINDISKLLDFLKIEKTMLFGGSWGGSLAFCYAIQNPHRVEAMLLRGVFAATRKASENLECGEIKTYFPEVWKRYSEMVPASERHDVRSYYFKMLKSEDANIKKQFAYEMALYNMSLLHRNFDLEKVKNDIAQMDFVTKLSTQCHYSENDFFLPDNYILNHLEKIENHRIIMVHGRYDVMCPPIYVYEFFQKLKNAELYFVDAGHASSDSEIEKKLVEELEKFIS